MFDPSRAKIFRSVKMAKVFPPGLLKLFAVFLFSLALISLLLFFLIHIFNFEFLNEVPPAIKENLEKIFFLSTFFFGFFFLCRQCFYQKVMVPGARIPFLEEDFDIESCNLADVLDFDSANIVDLAKRIAKKRKRKSISSLILIEALFSCHKLDFVFTRLGLDGKSFMQKIWEESPPQEEPIKKFAYSQDFFDLISEATKVAYLHGSEQIIPTALFLAAAKTDNFFKKNLAKLEIDEEDIDNVCIWLEQIINKKERDRKFWSRENLLKIPGLAKDWASGFTVYLDQFSSELNIGGQDQSFFGALIHQKETKEMEEAFLRAEENSVLLVGEPGVGRKTMINNFYRKITFGKSFSGLNYGRMLEIDMPSLIAAGRGPGELEKNLKIIFNDTLKAANIILLIRQVHNFIGYEFGADAVAKVDISGVLSQYLAIPSFRLIGLTTNEGFRQSIERVPEILPHFRKITVKPPTKKETLIILEEEVLKKERETGLFFSYAALREIVELCDRYIQTVPFPKKALDLLEEVSIYAIRHSRDRIILPDLVATIVSEKTEIPVGRAGEKETELLLNLEEAMHQRVVGQDEGISEIANALRRARADIKRGEKPIGTFLFLGPTGVGKTETAKTLAEIYFGSAKKMIRLDMSEYQELNSIDRLIGTAKESGYFTTKVREDPFSLVLLDELEKAHPNILDLFLQVLDEGHITDGLGRTINFTNTIIIATSNAGAKIIRQAVKEGKNLKKFKETFINQILSQGLFRPEFLNRFDGVVLFHSLSKDQIVKIAKIMLNQFKNVLKEKNIDFEVTNKLSEKIAELGYDPEFGGREMSRVIKEKIENNLARDILLSKVQPGDKIKVDPETFEIETTKQ